MSLTKVIKIDRKVIVLFSSFVCCWLLHVTRLLVSVMSAVFLATQLATVNLDTIKISIKK